MMCSILATFEITLKVTPSVLHVNRNGFVSPIMILRFWIKYTDDVFGTRTISCVLLSSNLCMFCYIQMQHCFQYFALVSCRHHRVRGTNVHDTWVCHVHVYRTHSNPAVLRQNAVEHWNVGAVQMTSSPPDNLVPIKPRMTSITIRLEQKPHRWSGVICGLGHSQ